MRIRIILFIQLVLFSNILFAQKEDIDHKVNVVKAYKPSISDAYKMNILPKIIDTTKIQSDFKYQIYPKALNVDFQLEPIKPAKLEGEPLTKLYRTFIKLGFGNYFTPLAEIYINKLRSKKSSWGAYYNYLSSSGKLKIRDEKVFAGYSDNSAGIFGKKFLSRRRTLAGDLNFSRNVLYFYGYTPHTYTITLEQQRFLSFTTNTSLKNNYTDSLHLNYKLNLEIKHLQDINNVSENEAKFTSVVSKFYNTKLFGITTDVALFSNNLIYDTINSGLLNINPWTSIIGKEWRIESGLCFIADIYNDSVFYHLSKKVHLQYNVVDNFLIPFVGYDGYLQKNSFRNIISENQFISPGLYVNSTNHKIILFGGIKGNFTSNITYNFKGTYSVIEDMYFFVNDTINHAGTDFFKPDNIQFLNKFNVVYDDIELLVLHGEIVYKKSEKFNLILKGNYYDYKLTNELQAWNKPEFDISLITKYKLRNKIELNVNVFAIGSRYSKTFDNTDGFKLEPYLDANLGIEYRYTKILSAFLNFNNIAGTKDNLLWYGYPVQRFNIMFGLTYAL